MRGLRSLVFALVVCGCRGPSAEPPTRVRAPEPPPSGTYAVAVEVVADDCNPTAAAPPAARARVLVQQEGAQTRVNLPLAWSLAPAAGGARMRSDLQLERGATTQHRRTPDPGCAAYAVDATTLVLEVSSDAFAIATTLVHGDRGSCPGEGPTRCTTRLVHRYTLQQQVCAAACTRGERPSPGADPSAREIDCRCDPRA